MTSLSLDLVLPAACQQCLCGAPAHQEQQQHRQLSYRHDQPGPCDGQFYNESGTALVRQAQQNPHPVHLLPRGHREGEREAGGGGFGPRYHQDREPPVHSHYGPVEDEDESLERPLPLVSDTNQGNLFQAQQRAMPGLGQWWEKPQALAIASHALGFSLFFFYYYPMTSQLL